MHIVEISSTQNDLVKYCVKLQNSKFRKEEKLILLDGQKTINGLIDDGVVFEYFFAKKENPLIKKVNSKNIICVNDEILKKISTTKTPTDSVGIIKEPTVEFSDFYNLKKIALIDGVKDAGNLGTIIRSACAFCVEGIILFNDCVDLYNSKTIRAAAQNMFKIPLIATYDVDFIKKLKKNHKLISTVVDSYVEISQCKFGENYMLAFGSEADGISKTIYDISDEKITLKMNNDVESLNLGVCASIVFALIRYLK